MKYLLFTIIILGACRKDCKQCETESYIISLSGAQLSHGVIKSEECGDDAEGFSNKKTSISWTGQKATKVESRICN